MDDYATKVEICLFEVLITEQKMSAQNDISVLGALQGPEDPNIVKEFVATLSSSDLTGGKCEKPYIYLQAWIPDRWWDRKDMLFQLIKYSNRWLTAPLEDGQIPHFRLSSGLKKKKSNNRGFFKVTFEIDEYLFPIIAERKGQFRISMTEIKFFGSGMVAAAKRMIGERYERMIDQRVDSSAP